MGNAGPLSGLKVVEFGTIGPVPFCGMMLADMGAEIVLIEPPVEREARMPIDAAVDPMRRGRSPIALNLKDPESVARALDMIARADVVLEGFRPGVMERLGLGPDICLARNPALVYGRVTGWGRDGPLSHLAGHDPNYSAIIGLVHSIGPADGAPMPPLNIADFAGGAMFLLSGVLAGVAHVRGGGKGQVVDASILDGAAMLMTLVYSLRSHGMWSDRRGSNLLDGGCPFGRTYRTRDGRYMMVCCLEPRFYAEMLRLLEIDAAELPPQQDPEGWPMLHARFEAVFAGRDFAEWIAVFADSDACVTPVLTVGEAPLHPHNVVRGVFGEDAIPAASPRFTGTPTRNAPHSGPPAEELTRRWAGQPRGAE